MTRWWIFFLCLLMAAPLWGASEIRVVEIPECSSSFVVEYTYDPVGVMFVPATVDGRGHHFATADVWQLADETTRVLLRKDLNVYLIPGEVCFDADPRRHVQAALPKDHPCLICDCCGEWKGEPLCILAGDKRCGDNQPLRCGD